MGISVGRSTYEKISQHLPKLYVYMWYNLAVSYKGIYLTEMGACVNLVATKMISLATQIMMNKHNEVTYISINSRKQIQILIYSCGLTKVAIKDIKQQL